MMENEGGSNCREEIYFHSGVGVLKRFIIELIFLLATIIVRQTMLDNVRAGMQLNSVWGSLA